jgi:DNA-binding transcriptional LysR family regulator
VDQLEGMRVFVAVAELGGFAPAARRLRMSPPAVTRAVAALEERIGARLFQRTTRVVRLTGAGTRFLADTKRILGELEEAESSAAGLHSELRGELSVTSSLMFGRMFVAPVLLDFLGQHPKLTARSVLIDRVVDLVQEGFDVAVRISHLADSSLSAVRVGAVRVVVCATPAYLAQHGVPRTPAELAHFDAIAFSTSAARVAWSFGTDTVRPRAQLVVNSAEVAIAAALQGRGLARALSYQVESEVRAGRLQIVLQEYEPPEIPIHVVHAEGRRAAARVRAFVDFTVERLRSDERLHARAAGP